MQLSTLGHRAGLLYILGQKIDWDFLIRYHVSSSVRSIGTTTPASYLAQLSADQLPYYVR